ncbi:MAG: hypothetical protein AB1631_00175 [Acidobacteriota bacterium]
MSINKNLPHVLVLPEDAADSELAISFLLSVDQQNQMRVLPVARGWKKVFELFKSDHIAEMNRYPDRFMVLLIDFDGKVEFKLRFGKKFIPEDLADRVFVLGTLTNPEDLKKAKLGSYETIGSVLAKECREETYTTSGWGHDLLQHNADELDRLRQRVRSILF